MYHSGAALQYTASYQDLKPINVKGTQEVLRFACAGRRIKPVHFVSTLSVFPTYTADTLPMHEETSIEFGYDGLEGGYAQSKSVAERLIMQARKRGLPVIENQQAMERLRRLGIEIPSVTERMLHRFLTFVQQKK
ncbi:SDR family oxidoreductase [Thermosporothrix hazakensis]|uniref:SDR family oxidoreductase n=1 Tax=Thermosporothrix hazakensis TaxID=644383 RepID=UPI002482F500|nr:SDR family oxidoreductase [Thermosporothrix hazakensis]